MSKTTLACLVLASSLLGCADRVITMAAPPPVAPTPGGMTVSGSATFEVSPDCADVTLTIDVLAAAPGIATSNALLKQNAITSALTKAGVQANDLKLSVVTLGPVYEYIANRNVMKGYRASITITATTKKFDLIAAILDAGSSNGATSISTAFRRSDIAELKKKVRTMALTAAKEKAKQTADALEIRIGRVTSVGENQGGYMWSNAYFPSNAVATDAAVTGGMTLGGALQPLSLDVTVTYELAPS